MTAPELEAQSLVDPFRIAHLDEDWAVPCEVGRDHPDAITCHGENPAAFILWPSACCPAKVAPILSCKRCLDDILDDDSGVSCAQCGWVYLPASTALRLIEPLNRRTT